MISVFCIFAALAIVVFVIIRRTPHLLRIVAILTLVAAALDVASLYGYVTSWFWILAPIETIERPVLTIFATVVALFLAWSGERIFRQ